MFFTENLSIIIIILFFAFYFLLCKLNQKNSILNTYITYASLFIYAAWYPPAIALIIFHSLLVRYGGAELHRTKSKLLMGLLLSVSLLVLFSFKYYNFFVEDVLTLKDMGLDMILPVGISFYTFTALGYYVDIYRDKVEPMQSYTEAKLFIVFWPALASGPVLRAKNIIENFEKKEPLTSKNLALSLVLISSGLIKKLLIADNIGSYVDWNIGYGVDAMSAYEAWCTILGFGAQIYADFSGYTDMAIGFALLLGFKLPANFNYPYRSTSLTEFWHRWHISLSLWFKDYLYIPLGGNKKGKARALSNIMIVFVLSGLWHGAGFGFLIWGFIHGIVLVLEKLFAKIYFKINRHLRRLITLTVVMSAWSFFRLEYDQARILFIRLFTGGVEFKMLSPYYAAPILLLLLFFVIEHLVKFYKVDEKGFPVLNQKWYVLLSLCPMLFLALMFSGKEQPFIYFQF
ncbi:MBOAT family O-acyltransferase [Thermodesulfobacteriota bacterium]